MTENKTTSMPNHIGAKYYELICSARSWMNNDRQQNGKSYFALISEILHEHPELKDKAIKEIYKSECQNCTTSKKIQLVRRIMKLPIRQNRATKEALLSSQL